MKQLIIETSATSSTKDNETLSNAYVTVLYDEEKE